VFQPEKVKRLWNGTGYDKITTEYRLNSKRKDKLVCRYQNAKNSDHMKVHENNKEI